MADPTPPTPPVPAEIKPLVPGPSGRKLPPVQPKPTNPFVYLGIPQAVLDWRPSRPGPKMSVFLLFSASLGSLYAYDRSECKRLQKEYMDKVRWMSEETLDSSEMPRKVKVLGARVPDDGELERSSKWFKKYMKPILVASGTDYVLKIGTNPGGLARTLVHEFRGRRITKAANEIPGSVMLVNDAQSNMNAVLAEKDLEEEQREMEGATVLLGRGALKEYLWALKKGYGEAIDLREEAKLEGMGLGNNERRKDGRWEREDELMSRELEREDDKNPNAPFEDKLPVGLQDLGVDDAESTPKDSQPVNFLSYSPYRSINPSSPSPSSSTPAEPESPLILPPSEIPAQPPLLMVPFSHPFGIRTWPSKIAHFWNHRQDVKLGGEYSLALLLSQTRPFDAPKLRTSEGHVQGLVDEEFVAAVRRGELHESTMEEGLPTGSKDLDFLADKEENPLHFKKGYRTMPKGHEYHRREYYTNDLPPRLKTARELASGERERTSSEESYPPKIESELRKERLDKELRWRRELEGWGIVRSGSGVAWVEGAEEKLRVIEAPLEDRMKEELARRASEWEQKKKSVEEERERMWKESDSMKGLYNTVEEDVDMSHQYPNYPPPSFSQQLPPPRQDDYGFQHDLAGVPLHHSSSSIYDDPEEMDFVRKMDEGSERFESDEEEGQVQEYAYPDTFSSPTPSSSNAPPSVSQLRPQPALSYPSQYSRVNSYYAPVPVPPQPDFTRDHQRPVASTSSRSGIASYRPPTSQYQAPQIVRPQPIRPMPIRTNSRPNPNRQIQPNPRSNQQNNNYSGSIPTNLPRHSNDQIRPQQGMNGSRMQQNQVQGNYRALQRRGSMGTDEAEYWGDEGLDDAIMQIGNGGQAARLPQQRPQVVAREPQVQYYDDLIPQEDSNASRVGNSRTVPNSNRSGVDKKSIKLKPINLLPDAFRSIWRFGVFNAVQSCCFDSVYGSEENVVVSAPTGAGKTVLFELAILRLFSTSTSTQSKVLYMAPTKSLCSERAADWKKKFDTGLGWKVTELTGDSEIGSSIWREVANSRIIVTTPEKWDALTRRWHDHDPVLSELRLFCVDEVHSVGADVRGAVLEVVVSRMKTLGTSTRFVAVSATVPNIKDVSEWLSNPDEGGPARIFEFGDEFRPCPLQKIVYGFNKNNNDFAFVKTLNTELFKIIKKHSSGNPVLIFCSTRKSCLEAAEQLVKDYKATLNSSSSRMSSLAWPKPPRTSYNVNDKRLAALIESGVSTHHAGMDQQDRKLVEKLFLEGKISIICSTSTLAVGVNLPARMVIIRGTKGYADGRMSEYPDMEILQMLGRAGRPQFDRLGVACIMTDKESQHRYENLVNAQKNLESCLHKNLTEHINSEITLRTITDRETALRFLHSTFLYVRITKNPTYYAIANSTTLSPDARLEEICVEAIKQLVSEGIVTEEDDESLAPNEYGEVMSRFYISHPTFVALKSMSNGVNMRTLLETLAKAEEFSSFRIRQGEKSVLAKVNKNLRFPTEKVASTADRIMILIQVVLEGIPGTDIKTDSVNPLLDINAIWSPAVRIAKALFDLAVLRQDGSARIAMELLRSLNGRCWDGTSFVLRQLKGIGEKSYKALVDAGIRSFADVASAPPDRLELILNRKPPYGAQLADQAKMFPKFQVYMNIESEEVRDDGVEVEVKIELSLEKTKPAPIVKKSNMSLYASVLVLTSDGHFIEFRRCPLAAILKGSMKPFSVSVILVKPSQRVVTSISCDILAGSEVRADVKPSTRASDFPIPSLASDPDANEVEITATSTSTERSMAPSLVNKISKKRSAPVPSDDEDQEESVEPRQRDDGRYECNHACKDKSKCKHLCCREGLDKPPRKPPANKKRKVSNPSRSNSLDTPSTSTKKRIPMAASSGVTLVQDAQGRVITKTKTKSVTEQSKPQNVSVDEEGEDEFELPTPDQLVSGDYQKQSKITKKHLQKKKVVVPNPSPPSPDLFAPSTNNADQLFIPRLPTPRAVKKRDPTTSKSTLAMNRSSKVSLKEFDSSSEEDELDEPIGKRQDVGGSDGRTGKEKKKGKGKEREEEEEPLFRSPSTSDQDFFAAIDLATLSGGHDAGGGNAMPGAEDELELDTALALAKSFEDVSSGSQVDADHGNGIGFGEKAEDSMASSEAGTSEKKGAGGSGAVEEEQEDDGFEAWLAGNVVIQD